MTKTFTAADMRARLRVQYGDAEWALLFEVLNGTGGGHTRSADAIAMNTWPSRGLVVHGFEIKVWRNDWQKELKQPAKADAIARYCDYWWLVAPEEIVKPGELPETWGHLIPHPQSSGLKIVRQATKLEAKPLDRLFVASVLRNAGRVDEAEIRAKANLLLADEQKRIDQRVQAEIDRRSRDYVELNAAVKRFEAQSGISIKNGRWGGDHDLGVKVKIVEALGVGKWNSIGRIADQMENHAKRLREALDALEIKELVPDADIEA